LFGENKEKTPFSCTKHRGETPAALTAGANLVHIGYKKLQFLTNIWLVLGLQFLGRARY